MTSVESTPVTEPASNHKESGSELFDPHTLSNYLAIQFELIQRAARENDQDPEKVAHEWASGGEGGLAGLYELVMKNAPDRRWNERFADEPETVLQEIEREIKKLTDR